jgi:plastocyanin
MPARLRPLFLIAGLAPCALAVTLLGGPSTAAATSPAKASTTATVSDTSTTSTSTSTTTTPTSTSATATTLSTSSATGAATTTSSSSAASLTTTVSSSHTPARARPAGDPSDTIADYSFTPATLTIHVGDTVTWTNNGPAPHTATANNGSFNTGTLQKGQSASHTFTQAGTYAYICTIHPFMHGTVVVLASSSSSGSSGSGSSGSSTSGSSGSGASSGSTGTGASAGTTTTSAATGTGTTAAAATGASLPQTGLDLLGALAAAGVLIAAGLALRIAARKRATD